MGTYKLKEFTEWLNEAKKPIPGDAINVFDVDDTLVITKAKIKVFDPVTHEEHALTPQEFNEYERQPHHKLDFSDFEDLEILKTGQLVDWVVDILVKTMKKGKAVGIITARSDKNLISDFLKHHGIRIHPDLIFAVNDPKSGLAGSIAERKKQAFQSLIDMGYSDFRFFDDDHTNLGYAKELENEYDNIKVWTYHIQPKWLAKFRESFSGRVLEKDVFQQKVEWWALFAHVSKHFSRARSTRELMKLFNDARKYSIDSPDTWPIDAVKYFYNWHLERIKDPDREKKAAGLVKEANEYLKSTVL